MIWNLGFLLLLFGLNGFFALSEMAIVLSRRTRLQARVDNGDRGAQVALRLLANPGRFLSTVQIGVSVTGIIAGAFGGARLAEPVGTLLNRIPGVAPLGPVLAFGLVVVAITYLTLVVGELTPKRIALNDPERIASRVAAPMDALSRIAAPLVWLLEASTNRMLRLLGTSTAPRESVTEDEIRALIAEATRSGIFQLAEKQMIDGVLRLADRTIRSIMTPRLDVAWLDLEDSAETWQRTILASGHSRFPVARGDLDEIEGIIETKTLLDRALQGQPFQPMAAIRRPMIVHDGASVMRLLELFKQTDLHIAIVVDEYGSAEGLVTITDIIEMIAGALVESTGTADPDLVAHDDGSWLIDGMTSVDDVEKTLELHGMAGAADYFTLAGFLLFQLGHLPLVAETVEWQGWHFEVVSMKGRRIDKILARPSPTPPPA
ncbi:MAG: hemolysin family protein [Azospirillaceae bacterium]|nr:hemolysin family protein [Azospirillaceae bacterium]